MDRRRWTIRENDILRRLYRKRPAHAIARLLGRTPKQVYNQAGALGLGVTQGVRRPGFGSFLRSRHAEGWTDSEIARAWGGVDRHAVAAARRRLGLPSNQYSNHRRACVRRKTQEQLRSVGLCNLAELRAAVFRRRAAASGWPADLRPRHVQMLNLLWERGPMTRRELAEAIGLPWRGSRASLKSNDPEGSYLAHLIGRGLVACLGRLDRGNGSGKSSCVYSLPLWIERGKVSA